MQNTTSKQLLSNKPASEWPQPTDRHPKGQPSAPLVKQLLDGGSVCVVDLLWLHVSCAKDVRLKLKKKSVSATSPPASGNQTFSKDEGSSQLSCRPPFLPTSVSPPTPIHLHPLPHLSRPTRHSLPSSVTTPTLLLQGLPCQAGAGWQMAYTNLPTYTHPPHTHTHCTSSPRSAPPVAQRRTRSVPFCLIRAWLISVASSRENERVREREKGRWWGRVLLVAATPFCTQMVIEESEGFEPRGEQGSQGACFVTAGTLILPVGQFLSGSIRDVKT